jgi:hypothetical protein
MATAKINNKEISSSVDDAEAKKNERLKRLQQLRMRQNEARKLNHKEVIEEDRKAKLPSNWEKQKERLGNLKFFICFLE